MKSHPPLATKYLQYRLPLPHRGVKPSSWQQFLERKGKLFVCLLHGSGPESPVISGVIDHFTLFGVITYNLNLITLYRDGKGPTLWLVF